MRRRMLGVQVLSLDLILRDSREDYESPQNKFGDMLSAVQDQKEV